MILIAKKPVDKQPSVFRYWVAENSTEIDRLGEDTRSARTLWELLGKTLTRAERDTQIDPNEVRYALQLSLYEEQGGICCYCGERLRRDWQAGKWEFSNQSIEHFKGKSLHKTLMFDYANLLLCCKSSSHFSKYKIGDRYHGVAIQDWDKVAIVSELPVEKIIDYRPNQHLKAKGKLENGDVIHVPNPTHCDDEKSKYDSNPDLLIINPTSDGHLMEQLRYDADGNIRCSSTATPNEQAVIENTIRVLGLGIEKLKEKRKSIWGKTDKKIFEEKYAESLEVINSAAVSEEKRKDILRKLIEKTLEPDDSDGLLAPFCFVEYASLKSQFSSVFT